jgi:lethal(2) giant larvae protein
MLGKEIQLKHRAPVIAIEVVDAGGLPVNDSSSDVGAAPQPHRVLIASEEQFKTFTLPTLKPCGKYKLTAHEGARIRRMGFTTFVSRSDSEYAENCFMCLTNQGDLAVHSLPDLRRQVVSECMKKEDVIAVSTLVFTAKGEAFYMASSSELQRVSLAAAHCTRSKGTVKVEKPPALEKDETKVKDNRMNEAQGAVARSNCWYFGGIYKLIIFSSFAITTTTDHSHSYRRIFLERP